MKKKNAQITLIMLVGIFIVMTAALVFYFVYYLENKNPIAPLVFERDSIENYINQCVKKTAENGLKLLGVQGGFITLQDYLQAQNAGISYLYDKESKVPSIGQIQDELSAYVDSNLDSCFKKFDDFKKQGWDVEQGNIHSKTTANERDVTFDINFPLKVSNKGYTLSFEKFLVLLNVRLKYIHQLASYIVDFNIKNPRSIDRTALNNYDVNITVFPYQDSLVYSIEDTKSLIVNNPYQFIFALKFE